MGLSLEFYAGNAAAIGADFTSYEWDGIRDGSRAIAYADFSLHMGPEDLDILSTVVAERTHQPPRLLLDSLTTHVGGVEDETGADVVDPAWVAMVAALDPGEAHDAAAEWIRRVGEEHGEALEPTEDAATAVSNLVALCRKARAADADVVHVWYL